MVKIDDNDFLIVEGAYFGFFANFLLVIGLIKLFEEKKIKGFEIKFDSNHCYFDTEYGSNWWNYYFEPLSFGIKKNEISFNQKYYNQIGNICNYAKMGISKIEANQIIKKYIKIKQEFLNDIDICPIPYLGIHFRGTDKIDSKFAEAEKISYYDMKKYIDKYRDAYKIKNIFVATDDQNFIDFMNHEYDSIYYLDHFRSKDHNAVHNMNVSPFEKGKQALVDMLILSKSNVLVRTSSNLSLVSIMFNPYLKVINTNFPENMYYRN